MPHSMLNLPGCLPQLGGDSDRMAVYWISTSSWPVPRTGAGTSSGILTASALYHVSVLPTAAWDLFPLPGSPGNQAFWRELPKEMASRSQPSCCAVTPENQGHKDGLEEGDKRFWDNCCLDKCFWQPWEGTEECTAPTAFFNIHRTANAQEPAAQLRWMGHLLPSLPPTSTQYPKPQCECEGHPTLQQLTTGSPTFSPSSLTLSSK